MPGRLHSKVLASSVTEEQNEIPTTSLIRKHSFVDASYSLELPDDELPDQYDNDDIANQGNNFRLSFFKKNFLFFRCKNYMKE